MTSFVVLGANGDAINALPLAYQHWRHTGERPHWVIAGAYAWLLDGVSYVQPIIFDGHYSQLQGGIDLALRRGATTVYAVQTYGLPCEHKTDSYEKEAYRVVNRLADWGHLPLVFDRRDRGREALIHAQISNDKPWLLVAYNGVSSPFPYRQKLVGLLTEHARQYRIIDLSQIVASRFYDLLCLIERSALVIAVDSGPLHLCNACPQIPVIALSTDKPTMWHGSARRATQRLYIRYEEFDARRNEIEWLVARPPASLKPILWHVYSEWNRPADAQERHVMAKSTWQREYLTGYWKSVPIKDGDVPTSSRLADPKPVPFVKDMIAKGCDKARDWDWVVLTNDDICFAYGLTDTLLNLQVECAYAHRHDFGEFYTALPNWMIPQGSKYPGVDWFAFTVRWWREHEREYGGYLVARESWDLAMKVLIVEHGGMELHHAVYHRQHFSYWSANPQNPGNRHNLQLTEKFLAKRGLSNWQFR